jgi:photosystem II stability/assembly factor-like uncharacterized protein
MGEMHDLLEREAARYRMPEGAFERVRRRRRHRQLGARLGAASVAVAVAGVGMGWGLWAIQRPKEHRPSPSVAANPASTRTPATRQPAPPVNPDQLMTQRPIRFLDLSHGWMVDGAGRVLATDNAGANWSIVYPGPLRVASLDILDARHWWATTTDGLLLRTANGGAAWEDLGGPALLSLQFLSPEVGWAVRETPAQPGLGLLVHTTDGGTSWQLQPAGLTVNTVCFTSEQDGWAAGPHEAGVSLFATHDGGATWSENPNAIPGGDLGWTASVRCGGIDAWVLASRITDEGSSTFVLFRTGEGGPKADPALEDGSDPLGVHGDVPQTAAGTAFGPVVAFDGGHADLLVSCSECPSGEPLASLEQTDDAGSNWDRSTVLGANESVAPIGMDFVDRLHGSVLVGDADGLRSVLVTADGGATWTRP